MSEIDNPELPVFVPPRSKWRNALLVGASILVCMALAYDYFVISSMKQEVPQDTPQEEVQDDSAQEDLQQAIAETDRLDPGWRIPQLEQKRPVIPEEQNAALVIMAAHNLLPVNWPFWDWPEAPENRNRSQEELRSLRESLWDLEPRVQLDDHQTKALRGELRRAGEALKAVRKVATLPKGRYPKTGPGPFGMGRLLAYDVLLRAQDEDVDGALTSCRGVLNCGRSFGDEPGPTPMVLRVGLNQMAANMVERTLAQGEPSEAALSSIQHDLEEEAEQPLLLIAARGERAERDEWLQAIQNGDVKPNSLYTKISELEPIELLRIRRMVARVRAALLKRNNQFVELAKLPVEQQVGRINELQAAEQNFPVFAAPRLVPQTITLTFHPDCAQLRCAVVMVAVERYRRANKRWPDALTNLVPAYLARVPLDPYDGAPLRYRRLSDGVVIYSVGRDGKDNGGKLADATEIETDLGFRLWDVPQRRRLPEHLSKNRDK